MTSSPPNKKIAIESSHFTKEECDIYLWDEFQKDYGVVIIPEVRERIYTATLGYPFVFSYALLFLDFVTHPGLVCLIGRYIHNLVQKVRICNTALRT